VIWYSGLGTFIIEDLFGVWFRNSDGKVVSTRDIAEQHILNTLGCIPSLAEWLDGIGKPWMAGSRTAKYVIVD